MAFGLWFGGSHLGFGTHLPILAAVVTQARPGPVVEYGMGLYSTPLLHLLCLEQGREALSLDSDAAWAENFADFRCPTHRIQGFANWADSEPIVDAVEWAVAFIDHGPDDRRVVDASRLANRAEFVVVHDWGGAVGVPLSASQQAIYDLFEHHWVSKLGPHTGVFSNVRPFALPVTG